MARRGDRARERVTAFCSNIVVTIDGGPGKYFIEIARSLTSRTISGTLTLIQEREREREKSRIDAQDLYLRPRF